MKCRLALLSHMANRCLFCICFCRSPSLRLSATEFVLPCHVHSSTNLAMSYSPLRPSMNRTLRILLILVFAFLTASFFVIHSLVRRPSLRNVTISPAVSLTDRDCKRVGFERLRPLDSSDLTPPIYDFFLFHDELDLLEIRLYELYSYVTLFLIVESRTTLSGKPKALHLKDNWQRFESYHPKMRRFEIDLDHSPKSYWANEIQAREEGLRLALSSSPDRDILLLTSDVDEIPAAHFLQALTTCQLPRPFRSLVLICAYYYYSFEFRRRGGTTIGATVTWLSMHRSNRTSLPSGKGLRDERFDYRRIPSACYHCSWCFDRINLTRSKMASNSHTELNQARFQTQEHILSRYRQGKDLFDRPGEIYLRVANNKEIPKLVNAQRDRFAYMWNRSVLPNAGFRDVLVNNSGNQSAAQRRR